MPTVGEWANQVSAQYRFADSRTPDAQVPDTPDGIFYKQVPRIIDWIIDQLWSRLSAADLYSQSGYDLKYGARETLRAILQNSIGNFPFASVANSGGWKATLKWLLERPIFTWEPDQPMYSVYVPRIDQMPVPFQYRAQDAYSASPGMALAFLGYGPDATYVLSPANLDGRITQAYYHPEFGIVFNKYFVDAVANSLSGMVTRQIDGQPWKEDKTWYLLPDYTFGVDQFHLNYKGGGAALICPPGAVTSEWCLSSRDFENIYRVETWRAFPWITSAFHQPRAIYERLNEIAGIVREQRRKEELFDAIKGIALVMSVMGLGAAIQAIIANGLTLASGVNLVVSVDKLPGVDLGQTGKYLSMANGYLDLESFSNAANLVPIESLTEVPMNFPTFDYDPSAIDYGNFDFGELPLPEISMGDSWSGFDIGSFDMPAFDLNFDSLVSGVSGAFEGFDLSKFITDLGGLYLTYNAQQIAAERAGTPIPTSITRPVAGTVRQLPDGSVAVTNPNGSTTVTAPNGQTRTITTSGQIVAGAGEWIPGVPNIALLGGAALIGVALLMRK
jgi:hypothetical protein